MKKTVAAMVEHMKMEEIDENAYNRYVLYHRATLNTDISINSYLRELITTLHFLMNEVYMFVCAVVI